MTKIPSFLLRDQITIEAYAGSGAYGDTYAAPVGPVKAHVEPTNRLVITKEGESKSAEALAVIRPENGPVPVGSRVTWGGVPYRVLAAGAVPTEVNPSQRELLLARQ